MPKCCSPQVEVKSRKTKENGSSHIRENGPHSSDKENPYIKTNLHTGCLRKIAKKRGTQIASRAHILYGIYVSVNSKPDHPAPPEQNPRAIFLMGEFPTPWAKKSSKPPPRAYKNELKPYPRGYFLQLFTIKT